MSRYSEVKKGIEDLISLATANVEKSLNSAELEYNDVYLSAVKNQQNQFDKAMESDDKEKALDIFFMNNTTLVKKQKERSKLASKNELNNQKVRAELNAVIDFYSVIENLILAIKKSE